MNIKQLTLKGMLVLLAATLSSLCSNSTATPLWYNGDFNGISALSNEQNTFVTQGSVYDNFNVTGAGWNINAVFSNNMMDFSTSQAYWEIRSGVSNGNGGTILYSGTNSATQTATGNYLGLNNEYTIEVDNLNIFLPVGQYWLNVVPIGMGNGFDRSLISTTSGLNAIGTPLGNDNNSFFDSSFFGASFAPASDYFFDISSVDFSMGVIGSASAPVPEPTTMLLFGTGLAGLAAARRKKKA